LSPAQRLLVGGPLVSTDVVGFQGSMMRDMAEALTQWEQLNPPQGGEPKKPRNLVLLGKQHSHPTPTL